MNKQNIFDTNFKQLDKTLPFTVLTRKIYNLENATNWDYAVMLTVSALSLPYSKGHQVRTRNIYLHTILDTLNLKFSRGNKNYILGNIEKSLNKLSDNNIIKIYKSDSSDKFTIEQCFDEDGQFKQIGCKEYDTMTFIKKNNDKISAMAAYLSLINTIFPGENSSPLNYVCYEKFENISSRYGKDKRAFKKSIDILAHFQVIYIVRVALRGSEHKISYVISRYCHRAMLNKFVLGKIEANKYILIDDDDNEVEIDINNSNDKSRLSEEELKTNTVDHDKLDLLNKYIKLTKAKEIKQITRREIKRINETVEKFNGDYESIILAFDYAKEKARRQIDGTIGITAQHKANIIMGEVENYVTEAAITISNREQQEDILIDEMKNYYNEEDFDEDDSLF